jgi:PAS domain-containing protein
MASTPDSSSWRPLPTWVLHVGVVVFLILAATTALVVRDEWQRRIGQSRARALYELVQDKGPRRPTETPGLTAWLNRELKSYRDRIANPERARLYGEVAGRQDPSSVPSALTALRDALADEPTAAGSSALDLQPVTPSELGVASSSDPLPLQFRSQTFFRTAQGVLVVTRRRELDADPAAARFLSGAARRLLSAAARLRADLRRVPLPSTPGARPPTVVRLYAVGEDGTLVSLPLAQFGTDGESARRAVVAEGAEFRKLPELPNFVPNEFVFRFDFRDPRPQATYSGLYLDLGGQGVVGTVLSPGRDHGDSFRGVLAADLTFDFDWRDFAAGIEAPMEAGVVELPAPARGLWRPWQELRRAARSATKPLPRDLALAIGVLADRETATERSQGPFYLYHDVIEGRGAVAALQVAARTWLLVLYPQTRSTFAFAPVALLAILLTALIAGFEVNRRRAERARRNAERELQEKQGLLDTMQIPLVVVDPNSDQVVHGNFAAQALGIEAGRRFGDLVAPSGRSHYERNQAAAVAPRRAYGVPVHVRNESGDLEERYAIVRSVAVTAPISALHADPRHRLGILFLVEPDADLNLYTEALLRSSRVEERRKLGGLLSHGVDSLTRILGHRLARSTGESSEQRFLVWLAEYVDRRVHATAWLLEHWDADLPLPPDCTIEAAQVQATLDSFQSVFVLVEGDPALRSRLHWDNGILAAPPADGRSILAKSIDWPADRVFVSPLRGGFGFFLGEVLVNAVRHGAPGSLVRVDVRFDRVHRELEFRVANEIAVRPPHHERSAYGGTAILERLADLFGWGELRFQDDGGTFTVGWRIPASDRGDPTAAD